MFLSVVICTYRRADRLERALSSLELQMYQGSDWEVLVIENDSISVPAVHAVIERHRGRLPLRHVVEPQIGLSIARNTAVHCARGEYLAYFDDDAEAAEGWLAALFNSCIVNRPDFCGGPTLPLYMKPKPDWYLDKYATGYVYGAEIRFLNNEEWLGGANFAVSKKLCLELGGFRSDLGMTGDQVAYGEETELMIRAWDNNQHLKVLYHPNMIVHHEVRPEKMTVIWNIQAYWAAGRSSSIMTPVQRKDAFIALLRAVNSVGMSVMHMSKRSRGEGKSRLWQQWICEVLCPWLWSFSRNWHAFWRTER